MNQAIQQSNPLLTGTVRIVTGAGRGTGREEALEGIRIIAFGQLVSAPHCAKLFADYGAEVVKGEPPTGDLARQWGPFPFDQPDPEKSGLFFFLNTNKRGVTLDTASSRRGIMAKALPFKGIRVANFGWI
jgi:crotonobetainyl-CoA:carnitine CoA-transferase CaiB-like acyl-CoA transferase